MNVFEIKKKLFWSKSIKIYRVSLFRFERFDELFICLVGIKIELINNTKKRHEIKF